MLRPFRIDHALREVWRSVAPNIVVFIGNEVRPGGPAEAGVADILRLDRRVVKGGATALKKRTNIICQPERGKDRRHGPGELGGKMIFRHHQRHILWYAIISPNLQDMFHQLWLNVQALPGDRARLKRIMLERNKGE